MSLLRDQGAKVSFHDPHAGTVRIDGGEEQHSRPLTAANLKRADLVIIVTDHTGFDYDMIATHGTLILDTRNATRGVKTGRAKIHKL
jgi:UDP-N-acetyl-D-glucosamine dehydrogenase